MSHPKGQSEGFRGLRCSNLKYESVPALLRLATEALALAEICKLMSTEPQPIWMIDKLRSLSVIGVGR